MKKTTEYRRHAKECLDLARKALTPDEREQLLHMATMWERLADDREDYLKQHPELVGKAD